VLAWMRLFPDLARIRSVAPDQPPARITTASNVRTEDNPNFLGTMPAPRRD